MVKSIKSKNGKLVALSTIIPEDLDARLREYTERTGIKIKAFVAQALEEKLERETQR